MLQIGSPRRKEIERERWCREIESRDGVMNEDERREETEGSKYVNK